MRILAFIVVGLEITETISWFYTKKGFTIQIVMALDLGWALSNHIEIVWVLLVVTVLVFILITLPIPPKPTQISFSTKSGAALVALTLAFQISRTVTSTFDPFKRTQKLESLRQRIVDSAARSANTTTTAESKDSLIDFLRMPSAVARLAHIPAKPNLIILELESLENELLGVFNSDFPPMLPFLSRYVQKRNPLHECGFAAVHDVERCVAVRGAVQYAAAAAPRAGERPGQVPPLSEPALPR
jgi:hypothetical protein